MKKIENIHEALDVFNDMAAFEVSNWHLALTPDGFVLDSEACPISFEEDTAVLHANNLSGYYTALEAERDAMRQELRSRAEAIVALTAEVERLRPVVEAARAYRLSEIAYDAEIDRQRAFPDSAVHLQVSRDFDDTEVALAKVVDALLATESGEGK